MIKDKFSDLKISRQRKWQLRKESKGLCSICGEPAISGARCVTHMIANREQQRKLKGCVGRYNSKSYRHV